MHYERNISLNFSEILSKILLNFSEISLNFSEISLTIFSKYFKMLACIPILGIPSLIMNCQFLDFAMMFSILMQVEVTLIIGVNGA